MKGGHEGGGGGREKVETGRQGAKKCRKKKMEKQQGEGRKRPLSVSKCV